MKRRKERRFSLFLAGVCTALLLTGCGEGESVHTGAEAQSEEAAETAEETDTGTPEKIEETGTDRRTGNRTGRRYRNRRGIHRTGAAVRTVE